MKAVGDDLLMDAAEPFTLMDAMDLPLIPGGGTGSLTGIVCGCPGLFEPEGGGCNLDDEPVPIVGPMKPLKGVGETAFKGVTDK